MHAYHQLYPSQAPCSIEWDVSTECNQDVREALTIRSLKPGIDERARVNVGNLLASREPLDDRLTVGLDY